MSTSKKKKCKSNEKLDNTGCQTLTSMYAKQSNFKKIRDVESDDDFVEITKVESKSRFFRKTSLKFEKNGEERNRDELKDNKRRMLSLRKLSSKIKDESSCKLGSTSSGDNSVILLSDTPRKQTKNLRSTNRKRKSNEYDYIPATASCSSQKSKLQNKSAVKRQKLSKDKQLKKNKENKLSKTNNNSSDLDGDQIKGDKTTGSRSKYELKGDNITENGQKLYVRLFSRKLQWINCEKLKYPRIADDLTDVIQELIDVKLTSSEAELNDLEVTLKILSAPDLKALAKSYHVNTSGMQKAQIIDILIKKTKQNTITSFFGAKHDLTNSMLEKAKKSAGRCIRLRSDERTVFVRVLMLFSVVSSSLDEDSANGGQSQLFQMLMVNMGKVVYPTYTINKQTTIFTDRDSVILYEKALQYEADLINCVERSKWEEAYQIYLSVKHEYKNLTKTHIRFDAKLPDFLRRYTTGHQFIRILSQGIEIIQRRKDYKGAVDLIELLLGQDTYCLDYHGYWWERLALNLDAHLKKPSEALEVVKKGMADNNVRVGHRLALYQRAQKICQTASFKLKNRLDEFNHEEVIEAPKTTIEGRLIPYSVPGIKHKFMTEDSYFNGNDEDVTMCNVEQIVLDYYKPDYPDGLHAEGSIISSLFTLFFWDILFMDVPDAFHSLYQTTPLDKMSTEFYKRREHEIDDRLDWLNNSSIEDLYEKSSETWSTYCETTCAGISWERLQSVEYIQGLIKCIGGRLLCDILSRYAKDPRHTRSGFPDLTIWNSENKTFKIVEVKGPGDRLSHKQILWLSFLLKVGVDAEVCHVKAVGAKKLKANA